MDQGIDVTGLYTPLSEAFAELERRRQDVELTQKINDYFSEFTTPLAISAEPLAILARPICTPNFEFIHAVDVQTHIPIKTVLYEYTNDKFVTNNKEKCLLLRLTFAERQPFALPKVTGTKQIADFKENEGKHFNEILTTDGESLVNFHHALTERHFGNMPLPIYDFNGWFGEAEQFDPFYPYLRYLGLFLKDAVLLEDFTTDNKSGLFTLQRVIPAFEKLERIFGVRPLIVPLAQSETVHESFWYYYPDSLKDTLL